MGFESETCRCLARISGVSFLSAAAGGWCQRQPQCPCQVEGDQGQVLSRLESRLKATRLTQADPRPLPITAGTHHQHAAALPA
jgi:hypothetical protein